MAELTNRSRFCVKVQNREDLTRSFPFTDKDAVKGYLQALRAQGFKPKVDQRDEHWLVRIRQRGHKPLQATFPSQAEAEDFIEQVAAERKRGLFVDYTASLKVTVAQLAVRYLLEEAPRHKSCDILGYFFEGLLADSGATGERLLKEYREERARRGLPVRPAKFKMRASSTELAWLHKPLAQVKTVDIEGFINDRLETVEPSTVDREIDRLKDVFKVATEVWDYPLAKNPMNAVRRPKYFNERDRRIAPKEETALLQALGQLDEGRAVEQRLRELAEADLMDRDFSSGSVRKKSLAARRVQLRPVAEETAQVVPYLQVFYAFQVMTAARRGETLGLTWERVNFEAKTAYLPETKNGRSRKLALRQDLVDLLRELPRETEHVFPIGLDYLVGAWSKACKLARVEDLRIHDVRHEALSRLAETGKFTLPELQLFSGHRDLRMLMRYAHLCASRLAGKLDESFKDSEKVRIHRGRRFLNKRAGIALAALTDGAEDAAHATGVAPAKRQDPARVSGEPVGPSAFGGNVLAFRSRQTA